MFKITKAKVAAVAATAGLVLSGGAAYAATSTQPHGKAACVQYGPKGDMDARGNVMLYDWNGSPCPAGTYRVSLNGPAGLSLGLAHVTKDFGPVASVKTGGSFVANSTEAGTLDLQAGTYLISLNAKVTPDVSSATPVFPQFFVYDQAKNAAFTGDLLNAGSGELAVNSTTIDSYYSGSGTITLAAPATLHFYAFGYSPGGAAGTYALDSLSVSAVRVG
jgi:hypothetical protein